MGSKSTEKLYFITLECHAKFEEKCTCGLKNDLRNLKNFHQSTRKSQNWDIRWVLLYKFMSLKFTGELYVMTMKNNAKFEKELTCQLKIDVRNLTHFDPSTGKSQKFAL